MAVTRRLDKYQRRHPWAGFPIALAYKYYDDFGPYLAAVLTYYGIVAIFPLLLLGSTVLSFVLAGDLQRQHEVLSSALHQFPVIGVDLSHPQRIGGGAVGLTIGIIGALYGGLGVGQALQYATNTAWGIPRNSRPNPLRSRGRGLLLMVTAGLAILGSTLLSILAGTQVGTLGSTLKIVALGASLVINICAYVFAFRIACASRLSTRDVAPGAIAAAVIWQVLQSFGIVYVGHVVQRASATNGLFALVLGLVAFLYLSASAVVICIEVNVVRVGQLHPRALLTPFTDKVQLTSADRRAYTRQAKAQRGKGFQRVEVTFDEPRRRRRTRRSHKPRGPQNSHGPQDSRGPQDAHGSQGPQASPPPD
ncbi:MAG TPA: YihY/virulence factor BrkB family protein [Streptosporangiaceae bacterium]